MFATRGDEDWVHREWFPMKVIAVFGTPLAEGDDVDRRFKHVTCKFLLKAWNAKGDLVFDRDLPICCG